MIEDNNAKLIEVMKILDAQLAKTEFVAGDFSYGDIPIGIVGHRFMCLSPSGRRCPASSGGMRRSSSARPSSSMSAAFR